MKSWRNLCIFYLLKFVCLFPILSLYICCLFQFICLSLFWGLSVYLFLGGWVFIYRSVYMSECQSVNLSVCLFANVVVCLSIWVDECVSYLSALGTSSSFGFICSSLVFVLNIQLSFYTVYILSCFPSLHAVFFFLVCI